MSVAEVDARETHAQPTVPPTSLYSNLKSFAIVGHEQVRGPDFETFPNQSPQCPNFSNLATSSPPSRLLIGRLGCGSVDHLKAKWVMSNSIYLIPKLVSVVVEMLKIFSNLDRFRPPSACQLPCLLVPDFHGSRDFISPSQELLLAATNFLFHRHHLPSHKLHHHHLRRHNLHGRKLHRYHGLAFPTQTSWLHFTVTNFTVANFTVAKLPIDSSQTYRKTSFRCRRLPLAVADSLSLSQTPFRCRRLPLPVADSLS